MIGKLKGRIDTVSDDSVILDVGGVGYLVFAGARTLADCAKGEAAELLIETHVREDHIHLFGFPSASEQEWFRLLTGVQGVGVKMALAILGLFTPEQLAAMITAKDVKQLTRASGVGPKIAERITTELKGKASKLPASAAALRAGASLPAASASEDAVSALMHLGYNRADAYTAVALASGTLGDKAPLDGLIRESLKSLMRQ